MFARSRYVIPALVAIAAVFLAGCKDEAPSSDSATSSSTGNSSAQASDLNRKAIGIAAGGGYTFFGPTDSTARIDGQQRLGATWFRFDLNWAEIQAGGPRSWDAEKYVRIAQEAHDRGQLVLGIIVNTPPHARLDACKDDEHCYAADPEVLGEFAGDVAEHFAGIVDALEIGNEPNIENFVLPEPNPEHYAALLKAAYVHVRSRHSTMPVIAGGTTTIEEGYGGKNIGHITWLNRVYAAWGGKSFMDAYAHHPYPAKKKNDPPQAALAEIAKLHDIMAEHGDGAKSIWVTEIGYSTGGDNPENRVTARQQAAYYQMIIDWYLAAPGWVGPLCFYSYLDEAGIDGVDLTSHEAYFGLVDQHGNPKLAYEVIRQAAVALAG